MTLTIASPIAITSSRGESRQRRWPCICRPVNGGSHEFKFVGATACEWLPRDPADLDRRDRRLRGVPAPECHDFHPPEGARRRPAALVPGVNCKRPQPDRRYAYLHHHCVSSSPLRSMACSRSPTLCWVKSSPRSCFRSCSSRFSSTDPSRSAAASTRAATTSCCESATAITDAANRSFCSASWGLVCNFDVLNSD